MAIAKPIKYRDIAKVLSTYPAHVAGLSTIAYRLKRAPAFVRRALLAMETDGIIRRSGPPARELFELLPVKVTNVSVEPEPTRSSSNFGDVSRDVDDLAEDQDDDPDGSDAFDANFRSFEQVQAARLWAERMGDRRWHDDPRATREPRSGAHLLPPFYVNAARDA